MAGIFLGVICVVSLLFVLFIAVASLLPDAIDDWMDVLSRLENRKMNKEHLEEILEAYNDSVRCEDCPARDTCGQDKDMEKNCKDIIRKYIFGKENE